MVLIDSPKCRNTSGQMKIDTGIAVSAISVGLSVPRKKNRIAATKMEAPISLPCSVEIEDLDEGGLAEGTCGASMPGGSERLSPASASSIARVQADGVGRRLLLDAENHGRFALRSRRVAG